jgi:SAM-dependent methyltransferase
VSDPSEVARIVNEGFLPIIREIPGFEDNYFADAGAMVRAGHSVTAIDPRAPEGPIFQRARIEEFSDPRPFDYVVAILSLHHVEDLGRTLDKIANSLHTGGALVVVEVAWERFDGATAEWALERLPAASSLGKPSWLRAAAGDGRVEAKEGPELLQRSTSLGGRARRDSTAPGRCAANSDAASSNASSRWCLTSTRNWMTIRLRRTRAWP